MPCADEPPSVEKGAEAEVATAETNTAEAEVEGGNEPPSSAEQPSGQATEQFDDLLFPTGTEKAGQPNQVDAASKAEGTPAERRRPQTPRRLTLQSRLRP